MTNLCACGCGKEIIITSRDIMRKRNREYIHSHQPFGNTLKSKFEEFKFKTGKIICKCGCGKEIELKVHHRWMSIPKYIWGHNGTKYHSVKEVKAANALKTRKYRARTKILCSRCHKIRTIGSKGLCHACHNYVYRTEHSKTRHKLYCQTHKVEQRAYFRKYARHKLQTNPTYKINHLMSTAIWVSLKKRGSSKNGFKWASLVNFTLFQLQHHLEKQFKKGMTWKNYGSYWHVDHRIPLSLFVFKNPDDEGFQKAWALENLQPKEKIANIIKSNKWSEPTLNQILCEVRQ